MEWNRPGFIEHGPAKVRHVSDDDAAMREVRHRIEEMYWSREPMQVFKAAKPIRLGKPSEFVYEPGEVNSFDSMVKAVLKFRPKDHSEAILNYLWGKTTWTLVRDMAVELVIDIGWAGKLTNELQVAGLVEKKMIGGKSAVRIKAIS